MLQLTHLMDPEPACAQMRAQHSKLLGNTKNCVSYDSDYVAHLLDYMAFGGIIFICGDACSSAELSVYIASMFPHRPDVGLFMLLNTVWRDHLDLNLVCALDHNRRVSVKTNDACRMCQNINYKKVRTMFFWCGGGKDWLTISQLVDNATLSLYLFVLSHKKHMNLTRHFPKHACSLLWKPQTSPFPVTISTSFHSLPSLCDHSPFRERDLGCPIAVETGQETRKPTRQKTDPKESLHKKRPTTTPFTTYQLKTTPAYLRTPSILAFLKLLHSVDLSVCISCSIFFPRDLHT